MLPTVALLVAAYIAVAMLQIVVPPTWRAGQRGVRGAAALTLLAAVLTILFTFLAILHPSTAR